MESNWMGFTENGDIVNEDGSVERLILTKPKKDRTMKKLPYPLRALKISFEFQPFGFWWKPSWNHRKTLTEEAKRDGAAIAWFRWGWCQVSISRWL